MHSKLETTVGTYPICYQKAILSEDFTCSTENTLKQIATKKMLMKKLLQFSNFQILVFVVSKPSKTALLFLFLKYVSMFDQFIQPLLHDQTYLYCFERAVLQ